MSAAKPTLYVFAISHFCEKARWALDYLGIDYALAHLAPGLHIAEAQKLGAPASSLPILVSASETVQGSSEIIDWADERSTRDVKLTPPGQREACRELEQRLDDKLGVHVRRLFYSEALVEHPETVKPIFTRDLGEPERTTIEAAWPGVRELMIARMDLGAEQGRESREIVDGELSWLDGLLGDGRRFLLGDAFSRVDLTAASLIASLAGAKEHPGHGALSMPVRLAKDQRRWESRPSLVWVRALYREYR